jgi:hypothetical protein
LRLLRVSALTVLLSVTFACAQAAAIERPRLGEDAVPISYDLAFTIDPHKTVISGDETIIVDLKKPTADIILNWRGLTAHDATVDGQSAVLVVHAKVQQLWVHATAPLAQGRHSIQMQFTSAIRDMFGPPPSGFWNDSMREPFLVTMFKPSTARVMFPCFDEPQFRASFTVHVTTPFEFTVISNMPVQHAAQLGTKDAFPLPCAMMNIPTSAARKSVTSTAQRAARSVAGSCRRSNGWRTSTVRPRATPGRRSWCRRELRYSTT